MASAVPGRLLDDEFTSFRELVHRLAGISLSDSKRELVHARLSSRVRELGLASFADYRRLLDAPGAEREHFLNALTTNLTSFNREADHFTYLRDVLVPRWRRAARNRLRLWSAGCSSGQEAYSMAIVLAEALAPGCDWRILATDINSEVVACGAEGVYDEDDLAGLPGRHRGRYFVAHGNGRVRAVDALRARVSFRELNLVEAWPMRGPLDVIFCRNVVIYFDRETQAALCERFAALQRGGGTLFLGHSESVPRGSPHYRRVGPTTYERVP